MATLVTLQHRTVYRYDKPVIIFPQIVRLKPAAHCRTPVLNYSLTVGPADHFVNWQQDPQGNFQARLVFSERTTELSFCVNLTVEMHSINPFDFFLEPDAEMIPFAYSGDVRDQLAPFLAQKETGPLLAALTEQFRGRKARTIDFLVDVNQAVKERVNYLIRLEPGVQGCEETLAKHSGSCRDSAFLLVQLLRSLGLAARFVSGYLIQLVPDEKPVRGPEGPTEDFTDLHAWAEVYLPGAGWIGLDATSGLMTAEGHIPLACSPEPLDAAPITGSTEPCVSTLEFTMTVERAAETPRVTKPYTTQQWQAIRDLATTVDTFLGKEDVQLTIGGEPTFVSEDNRDLPEWNIAANGIEKKKKACDLAFALQHRFMPGASLHSGQGKWYPGEELPRWAYSMIARVDGTPVWHNTALLARDLESQKHGLTEAEALIKSIAYRLTGHMQDVVPAYEDAYYYLWREGNFPADMDLHKKDLASGGERERLRILLERGLGSVTGYILPLVHDGAAWQTGTWNFRRGRLLLIPGDSAMGYRLPLASLPGPPPASAEISPTEMLQPFGDFHLQAEHRFDQFRLSGKIASAERTQAEGAAAPFLSHTALCVEPRDGTVRVFLPPLSDASHYLDLIATIEQAARDLKMQVAIEGYEPRPDARLRKISVTPDPGVIEVNIDPSSSWLEHAEKLEALYEEARHCGLTAEKFTLDGRRCGTGGGNHITLGGPHPSQSPFLRKPKLLASLVVFFQNHPSLSYFFSGLFTGPTSQSPRMDEGHPAALNDLTIALQELEKLPDQDMPHNASEKQMKDSLPLWLTDRLLRNLLTDQTGNTHRTEISIDKLFSPDSLSGRLGLVEFRAFEMPYHPRMNALQGLLLRAITAGLLHKPPGRPVTLGLALEDRLRLPAFLAEDLEDVLDFLANAGFRFDPAWFQPFLEARFPPCGTMESKGIRIELRTAIENWTVLGEEMFLHGTARAVDAAVERVQVRAFNFAPERYSIFCNGNEVPLQPTRVTTSFAGGVRFKAWDPARTMHPSLKSETALILELVDNFTGHIQASCTYYAAHPGGRSYDTLPVNEREAESRTLSRFHAGGKSPGKLAWGGFSALHPHTLDLRQRMDFDS